MSPKYIVSLAVCAAVLSSVANRETIAQEPSEATQEASMTITQNGSQPSIEGPEDWFTGDARIDPIHLQPHEPSRLTSAVVTFEPGARTNWHKHPLGQLLIVTSGKGWTQYEGGSRVEINAGDAIWCPSGLKH